MRLLATSDLHLRYPANRRALSELAPHPDDWLIVAGDLGEEEALFHFGLGLLTERFGRVFWTPGNHDLWTPASQPGALRGEAKYHRLVSLCRRYGVLTPEDPFVRWPGEGPPCLLAPLFLLYDYSFRPDEVPAEQVLAWAAEQDVICADEALLHPDPYPTRAAWCAARCATTEGRLARAAEAGPLVLINHFPLRYDLVRLRRIPRFSPWCGTRSTEDWHRRFGARAVVYGHLHVRGTHYRGGVRFEEVSLGYPRDWDSRLGLERYLREILPGPGDAG
jgi:3',5'-cyclic AMP phosphodiesterase CpdA